MPWNLYYSERNILEKELEQLSSLHRLAFAASICERFLPNYSAFAKENGLGNPMVLRNALDEAWLVVQGNSANAEKINKLIQNCKVLPPDEDHEETYKYEASMTCGVICYMLSACLEPTPQNVAQVAYMAEDIIFETIEVERDIANPGCSTNMTFDEMEKDAANHRFWIKEAAKQNLDFQKLEEVKTLDQKFIESFRKSCVDDGKSMIDLY
ncbi:hypothetical protein NIES267_68560 [Calothrix parasitica NIES-267]|uniref:DUF416 domain-containing protein n=1 Tax=Calothrix parasitica NIES-267 TaxID=1973488 RepID=A0A1Z4M1G0_9CYAN|nr:hypothetical protein NIES267_68560 [Calothrix parasitica NIES-267]